MGFNQAIKTCFNKFATFEGRARRAEYWMFYLFLQIVGLGGYVILMAVGVLTGLFVGSQADPSAVGLLPFFIAFGLWLLVSLVLMIPFLAVSARRLHDMGQSGHWLWLTLAGLSIVPMIMAFFDSEWGPNRWGEDPKAAERALQQQHQYAYGQPQHGYGQPQHGYAQQQYAQQQYAQQQYAQQQYAQQQYPAPQQAGQAAPHGDPFQQPPSPPQPPTP